MKPSTQLAVLPLALFAASLGLPAFGDARGYYCAYFCFVVAGNTDTLRNEPGLWFYYIGFVFANLSFLWATIRVWMRRRLATCELAITFAATVQVLSWLLLNVNSSENIQSGYYIWLAAFATLLTLVIKTRKEPNNAL
jgi:hypothetical protein